MKPTLFAIAIALSFTACTEPEEPLDSIDLIDPSDPSARVDPAPAASEAPSPDDVAAARDPSGPVCAGGTIRYWEWVCHFGQGGWKFEEVGHMEFRCNEPYSGALVGRQTSCTTTEDMHYCSGTPERACSFGSCLASGQPTTFCYAGPPIPPTFPPGGGVNG